MGSVDRSARESGCRSDNRQDGRHLVLQGKAHPITNLPRCLQRRKKASCIRVMRAMQGWNSQGWLGDIKTPTLVIVGDKDKSTKPSDSVVLWEGIPEAEFCVLPNCAHGAHLENPELFNRVVVDFLGGPISTAESKACRVNQERTVAFSNPLVGRGV